MKPLALYQLNEVNFDMVRSYIDSGAQLLHMARLYGELESKLLLKMSTSCLSHGFNGCRFIPVRLLPNMAYFDWGIVSISQMAPRCRVLPLRLGKVF